MGSSAVASWPAFIKALAKLIEGPTDVTANTPALQAAMKQYAALQEQPIRSRGGMERVVVKGKVGDCAAVQFRTAIAQCHLGHLRHNVRNRHALWSTPNAPPPGFTRQHHPQPSATDPF